jgi:hypothetical protein
MRVDRWTERGGLQQFARSTGARDAFGCGFIIANGTVLTVLAQNGVLRAFSDDDRQEFAANLRAPFSFRARQFVGLPGGRVAIIGAQFGDPADTVVSLPTDELGKNPDAIQLALKGRGPVSDRAGRLGVGPCPPAAAVVLRDPNDDEGVDDTDPEDRPDVWGFTGAYVRDLSSGALVEQHSYVFPEGYSAIGATSDWIVVQRSGGIDLMDRHSRLVRGIPAAILDIDGMQVVRLANGAVTDIVPLAVVGTLGTQL